MSCGEIIGLGYVGVRTASLDDWRSFGTRLLGMQTQQLSSGLIGFRMDDAANRLTVREAGDDGIDYYGWEVRDADALQSLGARIADHGCDVVPMSASLRAERLVSDGFCTVDPAGNLLEFIYGQARAETRFEPGRPILGFRTGSLGMGHVVLNVARIDQLLPYYRDLLGFRLSDYTLRPFKAYFFHTNVRHHSLALIESEHVGLHHLMVELAGLDDVGQGYDLAQLEPGRVAATLGRHSNDHMTSFYVRTPSRFMVEYGWGGRDIDPESWRSSELQHGPSLWGHDRDWLSDDLKAEARRMRLAAAAMGERAPLRIWSEADDLGVWSDPLADQEQENDTRVP
jgi:2,3-dihydroxybiphenyl 1,2-dioxygenase